MSTYRSLMADSLHSEPSARQVAGESFYSGALDRICQFMFVIGPLAVALALWKFGILCGIGLALGCGIAFVNFYWLKRAISGFADRASGAPTSQSGSGIVARFMLRYTLIGVAAYAILMVSPGSLNGLLAGLFLPVVAIICEAAYEVYVALTRGI
jgi:hypothetical protein